VFFNFKMDFTPVPLIHRREANSIKTPITLIAAKNDIIFPGVKMIKRAKKILPSLKEVVLLEKSKHVQDSADNKQIVNLINGVFE
jgi:esterase/lipase